MALFPSARRNPAGQRPVSCTWFHAHFKPWVDQLDIGHVVAHQARHTMATRLLRHGATLSHIRRYPGHVSGRMAEHSAKVAVSGIEDILQHVWVAGPTARAIAGLEQALAGLGLLDDALALDLRRPQDYFQRLWNTGFRAADLARAADAEQAGPGDGPGVFEGLGETA